MPDCDEASAQGFVPCFPEGSGGAAEDARVQVPRVSMTCLHRPVQAQDDVHGKFPGNDVEADGPAGEPHPARER